MYHGSLPVRFPDGKHSGSFVERLLAPCPHPWASAGRPGAPLDPNRHLPPVPKARRHAGANAVVAARLAATGRVVLAAPPAAGVESMRGAVRGTKCAATACAARLDHRLALLVFRRVSARKSQLQQDSCRSRTG